MKTKRAIQVFERESELLPSVERYLRNRTFRLQSVEVQFYEHRMDLFAYSLQHDLTVAVEIKRTRWLRAVEQALLYQLCSDWTYIAMPRNELERVDIDTLKLHGLGLIAVQQSRCDEVLPAEPSEVLRRHYRDTYLTSLWEVALNGKCRS